MQKAGTIRSALAMAGGASLLMVTSIVTGQSTVTRPRFGTYGFDAGGENTSVKPGDDFYEFANGRAVGEIVIPSDRTAYGNFHMLAALSQDRVRLIAEDSARTAQAEPSETAGKVGALYKAFLDEARIEAAGTRPIETDLASIRAAKSLSAVSRLMGSAPSGYLSSAIDIGIFPNAKAPGHYAVFLGQAGLGLPDRDYYLTPAFEQQKAQYRTYVATMLGLAGWPDVDTNADRIVAFETAIAGVSWTRIAQRDPERMHNDRTIGELEKADPEFPWRTFMEGARLSKATAVVVNETTAVSAISRLLASTPVTVLQAWLAFHLADNAAPYLPARFVEARFSFRARALSGQQALAPRWKRGVDLLNETMGEAVGQTYVARYFPPTSREYMIRMVAGLKEAYRQRIETADWMDASTRVEALRKLDALTIKIGYPDRWRDYGAPRIRADDLSGDVVRSRAFEWSERVRHYGDPVDRTVWAMPPQEINAYNNPSFNEVVFPAGLLQPPFFDPAADAAVNYGAIGAVIGHEMTHGFDDQGRHADADGLMRDWWTAKDDAQFRSRAAKLADQFDTYEVAPGLHVQGKATLGENIADAGGLALSLDAYHASLGGRAAPVIDGTTGDQRFFLSWAQIWRVKTREEAARKKAVADFHSPEKFRVNGIVRNMDAWYRAFDIKPTDKLDLSADGRVRIW